MQDELELPLWSTKIFEGDRDKSSTGEAIDELIAQSGSARRVMADCTDLQKDLWSLL